MNPLIHDSASKTTARLHEVASDYLNFRKSSCEHICYLKKYNEQAAAAIRGLEVDERNLKVSLQQTQSIETAVKEIAAAKDKEPVTVHLDSLRFTSPDHLRVIDMMADCLAEEDVLNLLTSRQGENRFESCDDYVKALMKQGRLMFEKKFVLHRLQRQLHVPVGDDYQENNHPGTPSSPPSRPTVPQRKSSA